MNPFSYSLYIVVTLMGMPLFVNAQPDFCQLPSDNGSLSIEADSAFYQVMDSTLKANLQSRKIKGYRIQIYFGGNRKKATKAKSRFLKKFPDQAAYTLYQQPNFKIRIGNFRNKLEAQKLYHDLQKVFNTVFIVPTRIEYPPLPQVN